jgi:hypothetical protein
MGDLEETVSGRIVNPRVIVGTTHASLEVDGLPGNLLGGELARVWHPTVRNSLHDALLPPGLEVLGLGDGSRILDPLDYLCHGNEVDVVVVGQDLVDPVQEGVQEFGVVLQPSRVEVETERRSVLFVVTVEVVVEEVVELVSGQDVGAGVHHGAPRKVLVVGGVFPAVQLVQDHLPNGVTPGGTTLQVSVAAMGHPEVHGVRPEGWVAEGSGDGGVVQEGLFLHHGELVVAAHSQVRSSDSDHAVVGQVGVLLGDDPHAGHLFGPVVDGGVGPEALVVIVTEIIE